MLAVVDTICRRVASAGQTARRATNASGVVAGIGKRAASGENAKQGGSGTSGGLGNASVNGEEADTTTGIAGNMFGPAGTSGPHPTLGKASTGWRPFVIGSQTRLFSLGLLGAPHANGSFSIRGAFLISCLMAACTATQRPIRYPGNCYSPSDLAADGSLCGRRAASLRPGGY